MKHIKKLFTLTLSTLLSVALFAQPISQMKEVTTTSGDSYIPILDNATQLNRKIKMSNAALVVSGTYLIQGANTYTANTSINNTGTFLLAPSSNYSLTIGGNNINTITGSYIVNVPANTVLINSGSNTSIVSGSLLTQKSSGNYNHLVGSNYTKTIAATYGDETIGARMGLLTTSYLTRSDTVLGLYTITSPSVAITSANLKLAGLSGLGTGKFLTTDASGNTSWGTVTAGWGLSGNDATTAANFLGTTDNISLRFRTNNLERAIIDSVGLVGIGTATPTAKLHVQSSYSVVGTYAVKIHNSSDINVFSVQNSGHISAGVGSDLFIGNGNGALATPNNNNIGIGVRALELLTSGNENTAIGYQALQKDTSGYNNTAIGSGSQTENLSGYGNTSIGGLSIGNNKVGVQNTAIGYQALYSSTSVGLNTAIGYQSAYNTISGYENTAIGVNSLKNNSSGIQNTAIGAYAGEGMTSSDGVFIGYEAGKSITGNRAIAIGALAGKHLVDGTDTIIIGNQNYGTYMAEITNSPIVIYSPSATTPTLTITQFNGNVKIVNGTQGNGKVLTSDANGAASWGSVITSGTYTATITDSANVSTTNYEFQYLRVGSVVTVSGQLDVDPVAPATSTIVAISLPIASNFAASNECGGTAFCPTVAAQGAAIFADATNNRAIMKWISADLTNQPMHFSFSYQIK